MARTMTPSPSERDAVRVFLARLKDHRLSRNWTQAEAAARAGLSKAGYQNLETGYGNITLMNLVRLLSVFGFHDRISDLLPPAEKMQTLETIDAPVVRQRARAKKTSTGGTT